MSHDEKISKIREIISLIFAIWFFVLIIIDWYLWLSRPIQIYVWILLMAMGISPESAIDLFEAWKGKK